MAIDGWTYEAVGPLSLKGNRPPEYASSNFTPVWNRG